MGIFISKVASDTANNLYCIGSAYNPGIWGSDTVGWGNTPTWGGAYPFTNAFLYKLNPTGKLLWARFAGGMGHDGGVCPLIAPDGTSVYVAGSSSSPDSMSFGTYWQPTTGAYTLFVAKTSTDRAFKH